jgi:hypothetical protein
VVIIGRESREPKRLDLKPEQIREYQISRLTETECERLLLARDRAYRIAENEAQGRPQVSEREGPWMAQTGGVEGLSPKHLESARQSYERWPYKGEHSFADYVAYTQRRWAENPGLLEEWKRGERMDGSESQAPCNLVRDYGHSERWMQRVEWDYGEGYKRGVRMRF